MNLYDFYLCLNSCIYTKIALEILRMEQEEVIGSKENKSVAYNMVWWEIEQLSHGEWTIVNKVDTIYKEKCQVQLLRVVPSTILLFHLVSSFRENYAVS